MGNDRQKFPVFKFRGKKVFPLTFPTQISSNSIIFSYFPT
nr:MAG TPA: hypothetical protein [Caudoviricetes sp.]